MTRKSAISGLALLLVSAFLVTQSSAQSGGRHYNPATETTVKGVVEEVVQTSGNHGQTGTHLMLKTDQGTYDVHVGPSSYIAAQQFTLAKGDSIDVLGSRTDVAGKEAIIARQITKAGKTLTLRDERGIPKWSKGAMSRQ